MTNLTEATANKADINKAFETLLSNQYKVGNTSTEERIEKLSKLQKVLLENRTSIQNAMMADFKRHPLETDMVDIYPIISEIKYVKKNLSKWLKKQKTRTPISLLGSKSYYKYESKGVVLIISPWNFPFNLSLIPIVSAIAAGNTVVLKPSEITPNCSSLIKNIVEEVFSQDESVVFEGDVDVASHLLTLPFNHIFFTGSPRVGKIVMSAAAKHLASVTLELGGKSPVIVDETANIELAASRICQSKFANNGQICIAPDYLFVHKSKFEPLIEALQNKIVEFFGNTPKDSESFCRISDNSHTLRLKNLINDAVNNGAVIVHGGETDENTDYVAPTLLKEINMDSDIMNQEIFGPILPIIPYDNINDVIRHIQAKPKPLSLYIFSQNKEKTDYIINNTRAGGGCINHCAIHFYNHYLPFGGSNNSGIGKSHGFEGFKEFCNTRSILNQKYPTVLDRLVPPYNDFKQKIVDFTLKYL
jgi:aldehyde dehydrogenase (NAD+)